MKDHKPQFFTVAEGHENHRKIAFLKNKGAASKPGLIWLSGYKSTMMGTKAEAIAQWCFEQDYGYLRFDYSGHGLSDGSFVEGTISAWLEEVEAAIRELSEGPQILIGSSMGGWIALLLMEKLRSRVSQEGNKIEGMVLIAPAWDMTEILMWQRFSDDTRQKLRDEGVYFLPSAYESESYPITQKLIEDGRNHLIEKREFSPHFPIHILHGREDMDVPWLHSLRLFDILGSNTISLTLIKDGDHRLSRPSDIARLKGEIETLIKGLYALDG